MDAPRPTSDEGGTDDPGTPMDPQVQGQLPTAGAAHASHDMAGVVGAQAEGRATSELAADVETRIREALDYCTRTGAVASTRFKVADIRALVARVTDLEAQNATLLANIKAEAVQTIQAKEYGSAQFHRAVAAEAQVAALTAQNALNEADLATYRREVAALTQERDEGWPNLSMDGRYILTSVWAASVQRAEAAEAALATTRQALTDVKHELGHVTQTPAEACAAALVIARRALAATEEPA